MRRILLEKQTDLDSAVVPFKRELDFLGVPAETRFSKAASLWVRNQFRSWTYEDQIGDWDEQTSATAIGSVKKALLYAVIAMGTGQMPREGIFKSLKLLHLYTPFVLLERVKNVELNEVPERIQELFRSYMKMTYPLEKRLIWALSKKGFLTDKGQLKNGRDLLRFLQTTSIKPFLTDQQLTKED